MKSSQLPDYLGTVQYMSLWQASGRPLGFRSDQFPFGSIACGSDSTADAGSRIVSATRYDGKEVRSEGTLVLLLPIHPCYAHASVDQSSSDPARRDDSTPLSSTSRRRIARDKARTWLVAALVGLLLAYASALRFEAAVARFGFGGNAHRAMRQIRAWHPSNLHWARVTGAPYEGDPYSYLGFAREMRGFYDASVREPLFVFLTRTGLYLSGDHDIGITLASATSSVLLVLATYLLGTQAFGRGVGFLAAVAMAVERFVIGLSIQGWRDDTHAFLVVLWAWTLLRWKREPTFSASVLSGLIGGAACLTRITSLSFIVPGYAMLLFVGSGLSKQRKLELVGISCLLVVVLAAPFLLNCAIVHGDPLYSINYHTDFYLQRANQPAPAENLSFLDFVQTRFRPFEFLDTTFVGLTSYPFANKWNGFDYWFAGLGWFLSGAALLGGLLAFWSPQGRMLWLVYLTALAPYALTHETPGGAEWRFTLLAYPFQLISAGLTLVTIVRLFHPETRRRWLSAVSGRRRTIAWLAAQVGVIGAAWMLSNVLLYLRTKETIQSHAIVRVHAGSRDALFFGSGWYRPTPRGAITVRTSKHSAPALFLPLVKGRSYRLDFRIDAVSDRDSPTFLSVCANGSHVDDAVLQRPGDRIGSYTMRLPASSVAGGRNRLDLIASAAPRAGCNGPRDEETALSFWFVRIRPLPAS